MIFDYTGHLIVPDPEKSLIDIFLTIVRNDIFDGKVGSSNYRCWIRDITIRLAIYPDMVVPDLAATGYKMPERWNRLKKEYLNKDDLMTQMKKTQDAMDYQEGMYVFSEGAQHSHGNCLIALTWNIPHQKDSILLPRMNLFSRSTFFIPVGVMDLALGVLIGRALLPEKKPFILQWTISQLQLSAWMSLPFIYRHDLFHAFQNDNSFGNRVNWAHEHMDDPEYMNRKFRFYNRWTKSTRRAVSAPEFRPTSLIKRKIV